MYPSYPPFVERLTVAAASASDAVVPRVVRVAFDRTLVDLACAAGGGVHAVARELQVDTPAVDAWRTLGIPPTQRHRVAGVAMRPDRYLTTAHLSGRSQRSTDPRPHHCTGRAA